MHRREHRGNEPTFKKQTMKTQIIHHVNEDFTSEVIETVTFRNGAVSSIKFSKPQKL